jgi:hypothetical protein
MFAVDGVAEVLEMRVDRGDGVGDRFEGDVVRVEKADNGMICPTNAAVVSDRMEVGVALVRPDQAMDDIPQCV